LTFFFKQRSAPWSIFLSSLASLLSPRFFFQIVNKSSTELLEILFRGLVHDENRSDCFMKWEWEKVADESCHTSFKEQNPQPRILPIFYFAIAILTLNHLILKLTQN
jgi:hypothetical protein